MAKNALPGTVYGNLMEYDPRVMNEFVETDVAARGSNQSGMRVYNERLVLSLVRQAGAMAKAEIARKTGLSAQAVSVITRSLEADGLLERHAPVRGKIGQPSVPLSLAKDGAFFLGLKIGRRSLELVLTDFLGKVRERVCVNHAYPTPDGAVTFARNEIERLLSRMPADHQKRVGGLGIALPFQLWDWAGTLGVEPSKMDGWRNRNIAVEIGELFEFPVYLRNDASAACGAELVFGDAGKPRDFLYFFIGFFIGGGLVLDNTLYTGSTGNAAALGSLYVPASDGRLRQLVEIASLATLENAVIAEGHAAAMPWNSPVDWRLPENTLETWLADAAQGIGHAILSSVSVIDVNHVLIDGWMPDSVRSELVNRVRSYVSRHSAAGIHIPNVLEGSIGPDARSLGAASLPLSERFLVERKAFLKGSTS